MNIDGLKIVISFHREKVKIVKLIFVLLIVQFDVSATRKMCMSRE